MPVFRKKSRMRLKGSKGLTVTNLQVFLSTCLVFVIVTLMGLNFISKKLTPTFIVMAQNEAEQAVMYAINYGLSDITLEEMQKDVDLGKQNIIENHREFFHIDHDPIGNVDGVIFDTTEIRNFLFKKTARIQTFMRLVENGKISIEHKSDRIIRINKKPVGTSASVPLGKATDTSLFGNLGPNIPIHFDPISDVETNVEKRLVEKGINSVQLQLVVHVKVQIRVVLPFATKPTAIEEDIPIAEYLYQGDIPDYINGKSTKNLNESQ